MAESKLKISEPLWAKNDPRRPQVREVGKNGEHVGHIMDGVFRTGDVVLTRADLRNLIAEMENMSR